MEVICVAFERLVYYKIIETVNNDKVEILQAQDLSCILVIITRNNCR